MLTDATIRKTKPQEKPVKLTDEAGLHLLVTPAGGKLWRYRYEIKVAGLRREKLLALGKYPAMSLSDARTARDAARALLDKGRDPSEEKKRQRAHVDEVASNSFEAVASRWHSTVKDRWVDVHARAVWRNLELHVFPHLGKIPVTEITPRMVLNVIRPAEVEAIFSAHRARRQMSAVFVFAIAEGLIASDPAATVRQAIRPAPQHTHHPAMTSVGDIRALLAKTDTVACHPTTRLGFRLLALTAVRTNELCGAEIAEFDIDGSEPLWRIPKERMKGRKHKKREHWVPLAPQAVEVIKAARALAGKSRFLFPGLTGGHKPMCSNVFTTLIVRVEHVGLQTPHGFRASFSTIMNERHRDEADRAVINLMLAHVPGDAVEAAYNRAAYMPRRRELACEWAGLITKGLTPPADMLQLPRRSGTPSIPQVGEG
jgi:integrase